MKWKALHALFVKELSKAKKGFYSKKIRHLRNAKPKQWHRELKKLTHFDKGLSVNYRNHIFKYKVLLESEVFF